MGISIDENKSIVSIYYGNYLSSWINLYPPNIEFHFFDSSNTEEQYKAIKDYFPDVVIVNKNNQKGLKQYLDLLSTYYIKVNTKEVCAFFEKSWKKTDKEYVYIEYYMKIMRKVKDLITRPDVKALTQAIYVLYLFDASQYVKTNLYIFKD